MNKDDVGRIALDILRDVLAYEGDFRDDMTFAELNVWAADLLDLNFRLMERFGQDLSTPEIRERVETFKGKRYDWITVGSYVQWVWNRLEALHVPLAA